MRGQEAILGALYIFPADIWQIKQLNAVLQFLTVHFLNIADQNMNVSELS